MLALCWRVWSGLARRTAHGVLWAAPVPLVRTVRLVAARVRLTAGTRPLSVRYGFDRGLPVARYYLEQFLKEFSSDIRGDVLEFQADHYTSRFGGSRVASVEILHKTSDNPRATIVADLTVTNPVPSDRFDCIVCTHVLHEVFDLQLFLAELRRILKPGGVLLVGVPHVGKCSAAQMWRFTPEGLHQAMVRVFDDAHVIFRVYGNSLTAAGELRGLVASEFTSRELAACDPECPVEVCARAVKADDAGRAGDKR